jgi:hypothetical protein
MTALVREKTTNVRLKGIEFVAVLCNILDFHAVRGRGGRGGEGGGGAWGRGHLSVLSLSHRPHSHPFLRYLVFFLSEINSIMSGLELLYSSTAVQCTQHTTVLRSVEGLGPPTPSPRSDCVSPPWTQRREEQPSLAGEGRDPIRTTGKKAWHSVYSVLRFY